MDTTLHVAPAIMGGAAPHAAMATAHRITHTSRADDKMASTSALILTSTTHRTQLLQGLIHRLMTAPALPAALIDDKVTARALRHPSCQMTDRRRPSQTSTAQQQNSRYAASGLHKQAASQHEAAAQLHREAAALHEAAQPIEARAAADRALSSSAQAHLTSAAAE